MTNSKRQLWLSFLECNKEPPKQAFVTWVGLTNKPKKPRARMEVLRQHSAGAVWGLGLSLFTPLLRGLSCFWLQRPQKQEWTVFLTMPMCFLHPTLSSFKQSSPHCSGGHDPNLSCPTTKSRWIDQAINCSEKILQTGNWQSEER